MNVIARLRAEIYFLIKNYNRNSRAWIFDPDKIQLYRGQTTNEKVLLFFVYSYRTALSTHPSPTAIFIGGQFNCVNN